MNSCQDASFDLFSRPLTEVGLQDINDQEVLPISAVSDATNAVEFLISSDGTEYTDLAETRLYLRAKITTADGNEVADNKVSLVKFWPGALWKQADLYLNGTLVTNSSGMYNYLSYISSQLSFPESVKKYQLSVLEHADGWNVTKSNPVAEALVRLHLPLCNQQRLIPNGVRIHLRLLRSADEFLIMKKDPADTNQYRVQLEAISLFVRRVTPTPGLLLEHASLMSKMNCVFPVTRIWPKFFTLQKGVKEFDLGNITQGQLPTRIIVGLVKTNAYSGSTSLDPYEFQHFGLDYLSLQCNGRAHPAVPLTANFSKDHVARVYQSMIDTIQGPCSDSESLGISLDNYKNKNCFFGFTLARALNGQQAALPPRESGYINAKLRFNNVLSENVNAIFFLEYNNSIEIDQARNIYIDFAA
jgi:hypothetical protein